MMSMKSILTAVCLMFVAAVTTFARSEMDAKVALAPGDKIIPADTARQSRFVNRLIAPKGGWQTGISVMYVDFTSANSEYMMLLQGVRAGATMLRLAPEAAYTYANNRAIGLRVQYSKMNGAVDTATADLLGNFNMKVENIKANSQSMSANIFHRTYWGLDKNGRVGIFWDYVLGYTRKISSFRAGSGASAYSVTNKMGFGLAPGVVYFPMNNISIQASIGLADLSYNNVKAYEGGVVTGMRHSWKAAANLNVLAMNFGLTIHF